MKNKTPIFKPDLVGSPGIATADTDWGQSHEVLPFHSIQHPEASEACLRTPTGVFEGLFLAILHNNFVFIVHTDEAESDVCFPGITGPKGIKTFRVWTQTLHTQLS